MSKKSLFTIILALLIGWVNAATITWTGANDNRWGLATNWTPIGVPTASDSVVINMDSVIIDIPFAKARTIVLSGSNTALTVEKESELKVGPTTGYGIEMLPGTLLINYGILICDDTKDEGIFGNATIRNHGDIQVYNAGDYGIRALGSLTNFVNSDVLISNCSIGLLVGDFENNGSVTIKDVDGVGFTGSLVNNGVIDIKNISCNFCYAFFSPGLTNNSTISISKVTGGSGMNIGAGASNFGTINIDSIDGRRGIFASTGSTSNLGTINISNIYPAIGGIGLTSDGNFTNAGTLDISGAKNIGIEVNGNFTNDAIGVITISSGNEIKSNIGVWVKDTIINFGSLMVSDSTTVGFDQIVDPGGEDVLTINSGLISINSSATSMNLETGNFNNGGTIDINNCKNGPVISNTAFINTSSSELTINVSEMGLELIDLASFIIQNNSMCSISSQTGDPLSVELGSELDVDGELDTN